MIVRNEAKLIETCLRDHRGLADEAVVLDTGSSDGTPDLARRAGARVETIAWPDDFAVARNACLDLARGDWALVLDPDERILPADFALIRALLAREEVAGYTTEIRTYSNDCQFFLWRPSMEPVPGSEGYAGYYVTEPIRLFRRRPDIRFEGQVHESVMPAFRAGGLRWDPAGVVIHHFGESRPGPAKAEKLQRYLALAEAKAAARPDDAQAQAELGFTSLEAGDLRRAVTALRKAVALEPTRPLWWDFLGAALVRARDWAAATQCYADAMQRFPERASFFAGAGEALIALGQTVAAVTVLSRCLALDPLHPAATVNAGLIALEAGQAATAVTYFERALALNPQWDVALLNLGLAEHRLGRREAALAHLGQAVMLNPDRWQALLGIGDCHFAAGAYDEAAIAYARAAGVEGHGAEVEVKRCSAELARGNVALALELADAAAQRDPRYAGIAQAIEKTRAQSVSV